MSKFYNRGFTLLEILTVVGILAVIGSISVAVISITLRGTKKADLLEVARQNSDTALSQMVRTIRYAGSLDIPASCVPSATVTKIAVTSVDTHVQTTYECINNTINANNVSLFNTNALKMQQNSCSFVCAQPTVNDPPTITIQYTLVPAATGLFTETNFSLPFQTSVTMRNLQ